MARGRKRKYKLTKEFIFKKLDEYFKTSKNPTFQGFAKFINIYHQALRYQLKILDIYEDVISKFPRTRTTLLTKIPKVNKIKREKLYTEKELRELKKSMKEYSDKSKKSITLLLKKYLNLPEQRAKLSHKVGFMTDIHLGHHDEKAILSAIEYLKNKNIDILILGGDIVDFESISYWKNIEKYSLKEELEMIQNFLSWIRNEFPKTQIFYIEANHELRMQRYILTYAKEFIDLDVLKIPSLFKLYKFDITYVSNLELLNKYRQPFKVGHLAFLHGHEIKVSGNVVNVARTLFLKTFTNILFGHFHTTQEYIFRDLCGGIKGAWSVGCLCNLFPNYRPVNNWNHGFAYIEIYSNGSFRIENKKILNGEIL